MVGKQYWVKISYIVERHIKLLPSALGLVHWSCQGKSHNLLTCLNIGAVKPELRSISRSILEKHSIKVALVNAFNCCALAVGDSFTGSILVETPKPYRLPVDNTERTIAKTR